MSPQSRPSPGVSAHWMHRLPFFYGWVITAVGSIGLIMTSPGQTYAVSIFIDYFIQELNLNRSWVSGLYGIATLAGSLALPWVGRSIDRYGPRRAVVAISVCFGVACVYMGWVQNAWMLGAGFVLIRMLGQGSLGIVSANVVNRWWVRRRGQANGISGVLVGLLGLGAFPNLIYWLIAGYEWRTAYMLLGALVVAVMVPVGWLLFRDKPEDHGLEPDGGRGRRKADSENVEDVPEIHWTLAQARRTPAFWLLAVSAMSVSMLSTGLFFHMTSIFADSGFSAQVAAAAFLPIAVTAAIAHLAGGVLLDRLPVHTMVAMALGVQVMALVMAPFLVNEWMMYGYAVALGTTSGLFGVINGVAWPQFFGRNHLGSIMGAVATLTVAGTAIGPFPFGVGHDLLGGYHWVTPLSALFPFSLAVLSGFKLRKPLPTDGRA